MHWNPNVEARLRKEGWDNTPTQCGHGHTEWMWTHEKKYPGVILHEDCCGGLQSYCGVIKSKYIAYHWMETTQD